MYVRPARHEQRALADLVAHVHAAPDAGVPCTSQRVTQTVATSLAMRLACPLTRPLRESSGTDGTRPRGLYAVPRYQLPKQVPCGGDSSVILLWNPALFDDCRRRDLRPRLYWSRTH